MMVNSGTNHFLSAFERFQQKSAATPEWLRCLRRAAINSFVQRGLPTTHHEDWRYTSVEPIASTDFAVADGEAKLLRAEDLYRPSFTDPAYNRIVFVNGVFSPQFSSVRELPAGVQAKNLSAALAANDSTVRPHLTQNSVSREQPFVALNTAFAAEGAFISIPKGIALSEPIYLVFCSFSSGNPVMSHPRNLIVFEEGSQARIVEVYIGLGDQPTLTNVVTDVIGGAGAVIDYYRLQNESSSGYLVAALEADIGRNCSFTAHSVTLNGALIRNDIHVLLNGEGSECVLNGLYLPSDTQHVDNHTEIEHAKPRATSQELYKGILSGAARAVFNGKILVHKDAQKTDARQTNKNLLLSDHAVVNTKPQLEIHADDVKCSHGSTIGQLDKDALFYLRSRGLDKAEAQSLLSYAFASDLIGRVRIAPLRARLDDYLLTEFRRSQG
jgi:Fe-S cluster assembly protein SufD